MHILVLFYQWDLSHQECLYHFILVMTMVFKASGGLKWAFFQIGGERLGVLKRTLLKPWSWPNWVYLSHDIAACQFPTVPTHSTSFSFSILVKWQSFTEWYLVLWWKTSASLLNMKICLKNVKFLPAVLFKAYSVDLSTVMTDELLSWCMLMWDSFHLVENE